MSENIFPEIQEEFCKIFESEIKPFLHKYEFERKFILFLIFFITIGLYAIIIFSIIQAMNSPDTSYLYHNTDEISALTSLGLCLWIFPLCGYTIIKKWFEKQIKKKIMPKICSVFGDLQWSPAKYKNLNILKESNVIPDFTSKHFDDIFYGSWKGVKFEIIEATFSNTYKKKSSESEKTTEEIFDGIIIKIEMNKIFNSHTVIMSKLLPYMINNENFQSVNKELKKVMFWNLIFAAQYNVLTNNSTEAKYLITPGFIKKLNSIKMSFCSINIMSCAFYKQNLYIAFHVKEDDLFSICSLFKPFKDEKQFFTLYNDLASLIKLIESFITEI